MDNSLFKALADPSRRKILSLLKEQEMSVSDLQKHFQMTQASLSHHLDALKRANLVRNRREGQFIFYEINTSVFEEAATILYELFSK
jgi:ArsR family transcriptional regulator, arsenate/arsenite/antimonite-responsive transcriptional repressor